MRIWDSISGFFRNQEIISLEFNEAEIAVEEDLSRYNFETNQRKRIKSKYLEGFEFGWNILKGNRVPPNRVPFSYRLYNTLRQSILANVSVPEVLSKGLLGIFINLVV